MAVLLGALLLVVAAPLTVYAAVNRNLSGATDRQAAKWTTGSATTSGSGWHNIPGLSMTKCTLHEVSETVTLTLSGGPVRLRGVIDSVPEASMKPGAVRFVPNGTESVTYAFVGNTAAFEANDNHRFDIQWQSPSGVRVTLHRAAANLVFQKGEQAC
jgi:hypothetical protein